MILKNLTRRNKPGASSQLLSYIFKYILEPAKQSAKTKVKGEQPFIIRHNVKSKDVSGFIKEFNQNLENRVYKSANQTAIHHTILSWSKADAEHITDRMLKDIAKQFIALRGYNNLYVGTKHTDRDHVHLHIAVSGNTISGLSSRQSKQAFAELKLSLDSYQKEKYPELINSLPQHGRSKNLWLSQKEPQVYRRDGQVSQKETMLQSLETAFAQSRSLEAFLTALKTQGHEPYYRSGQLTGIKLESGRKFRFRSLGYDKDKIAVLISRHEKEEQELAELRAIRGRFKERGRSRADDDERISDCRGERE